MYQHVRLQSALPLKALIATRMRAYERFWRGAIRLVYDLMNSLQMALQFCRSLEAALAIGDRAWMRTLVRMHTRMRSQKTLELEAEAATRMVAWKRIL